MVAQIVLAINDLSICRCAPENADAQQERDAPQQANHGRGSDYGSRHRVSLGAKEVRITPRSAARAAIVNARTSSAASCCYPAYSFENDASVDEEHHAFGDAP